MTDDLSRLTPEREKELRNNPYQSGGLDIKELLTEVDVLRADIEDNAHQDAHDIASLEGDIKGLEDALAETHAEWSAAVAALGSIATYDADQWTHGDDCPVDDPDDAGMPGCTCSTGALAALVNQARVALGMPVEARCGGCGKPDDACYCESEAEIGA